MKLVSVYSGTIKTMQNTPCKVAVFTDGKRVKVYEKAFYSDPLCRRNWERSVILERYNNVNQIKGVLVHMGYNSYERV